MGRSDVREETESLGRDTARPYQVLDDNDPEVDHPRSGTRRSPGGREPLGGATSGDVRAALRRVPLLGLPLERTRPRVPSSAPSRTTQFEGPFRVNLANHVRKDDAGAPRPAREGACAPNTEAPHARNFTDLTRMTAITRESSPMSSHDDDSKTR